MEMEKCILLVFVALILSSLVCTPAWAGSEDEGITVLESIIVTGSGEKTKLLDTNGSIHVITAKDIKNSGQNSTADLISNIPGVVNQKAGGRTYFSIRGTKTGMSAGPKIYLDGRPLNVGVYGYSKIDSIPLEIIEKIEVIKSPPPSKYGASAGRGVILITTKKGIDSKKRFNGTVSAEYGSWNSVKANAGVSGRNEKFDYNLTAHADERDGYRDDDAENKSMDAQVGWEFDGGRIDWTTGYYDSYSKYPAGLTALLAEEDPTVNYSNSKADGSGYKVLPNESDENLLNTVISLDYDKNDLMINASAGYSRDHQDFTYNKYKESGTRTYLGYEDDRTEDIYDVKATVGKRFRGEKVMNILSFGLDYEYSDFEQDRVYPDDTTGKKTSDEKTADIDANKDILGLCLNHELAWNIFRLQSGVRANYVSYELTNRAPDSVDVSYENDMDWNISPSVNVLDNANLFVTWSHSHYYLPLGYYSSNMSYDDPNTRPEDLKPETYDTVEGGWKHQMCKAFNYSLILYYTRIDDKIVSYYDEDDDFAGRRNAGTSIHKGVEVEVDGRPTDLFGYRLSFTTIDAEWDEGWASAYATPDSSSTEVSDLSGKTVNYVPNYEYSAGLDIYPIRNSRFGSVTIALDLRGFGKQYEDYNNNLKMSAADFLDAKVTWEYNGFECYLTCTNIFDREWNKLVNATGKAHSELTSGYYPWDGRYIGVGVSYKF